MSETMIDRHIDIDEEELDSYRPRGNDRLLQGQWDNNNRRKGTDGSKAPFTKNAKQEEAIRLMSLSYIRFFLIDGGSRSGKTFITIYAIIVRAIKYPGSRHCVLRLRYNHAKTSLCRDTIPKVLRVCFPNLVDKVKENKSESFYTIPSQGKGEASEFWVGGLDDKARVEKILGNEYLTLYFNECSQIDYDAHEIALTRLAQRCEYTDSRDGKVKIAKLMALYDCNPPSIKHWTYIQWYEGKHPESLIEYTEEQKKAYAVLKINPTDNIANVGEAYLDILKNMSPQKQKRFLEGKYSTGAEGALFTVNDVHKYRIPSKDCPDFTYCGVGVDPAAKGKSTSDETGIVGGGAAMIDGIWHYYICLDYSLKGKPNKWANAASRMYDDLQADKVIGETNNGGDMVEATIRTVDPDISYVGVHATRGKAIRAEPVASLSVRGVLHVVGHLPDLEDEMVSWEPDESKWSPNRLDAMVWMITWLMSKTRIRNPRMRNLGKR
jgi:hypothetical protein